MGWMTHKRGLSDVVVLPLIFLGGCLYMSYGFIRHRVIEGDKHWNESNQDRYDRANSGVACDCRKCKREAL